MFNLQLFMGISTDEEFKKILEHSNPRLVSLLLQGGDYLTELFYDNQLYMGKPIAPFPSISQLENLETHILSLLKKLAPDYNYVKNPPILVPYKQNDHPHHSR